MEFLFKCIRHIFKYTQCTLTYSCESRIVIMSVSYFTVVNTFYSYWGRWRATLSGSRLLCGWWFCSQCCFLVSFFLSFSCHFSVYQFLNNSLHVPHTFKAVGSGLVSWWLLHTCLRSYYIHGVCDSHFIFSLYLSLWLLHGLWDSRRSFRSLSSCMHYVYFDISKCLFHINYFRDWVTCSLALPNL